MRISSPEVSRVGPMSRARSDRVPFLEAVSCSSQPSPAWTRIAQCRRETYEAAMTTSLSEQSADGIDADLERVAHLVVPQPEVGPGFTAGLAASMRV